MNMMGYDAMALGEGDLSQLGVEVIHQRQAEAQFAFLSANAYLTGTEELVVEPYTILTVGPRRIAVVGITGPADIPGIEVRDPLEAAQTTIEQVRSQADILILLSHAGLALNREIANALPEIDLIVSGGGKWITQELERAESGPFIVHADLSTPGHAGRRIGVGTWIFDPNNEAVNQQWQNIALGSSYPDDPEMQDWVIRHQQQ